MPHSIVFRVQHSLLSGLNYCVVGLGNSLYVGHYNVAARGMEKFLFQLRASRFELLQLRSNEGGIEVRS